MKRILIFIFLLTLASCESQIGTAIGAAITNVVTGRAFSGSAGDEAYEKYKAEAIANPNNQNNSGSCIVNLNANNGLPEKIGSNLSKIKDNLCSCKTWGTCDKNSCTCETLCPDNFSILNRAETATSDADENSLAFTNGDPDFYRKDSMYTGYCWGHAVVTQRFNRLAKFDGKSSKLFASTADDSKRRDYYKNILKKLNDNMPVDIPGFKNLKEFSNDPEVKILLEEEVKKNWAENAMTTQGLGMISSSEPQGADYYNKLFDDIEFRVKNFQTPTIVFNDRDQATRSHAVIVSGVGVEKNGERYLCLRDNNMSPKNTMNCAQKMRLKADGTCYYDGWYSKIGKITLSHTENANTIEQMQNLRTKCMDDKNCSAAK